MALNASSHNIRMLQFSRARTIKSNLTRVEAGEKTGPSTGMPPPISDEIKSALLRAAHEDATGQQDPGQDGGDKEAGKKVKTEKECT